MEVEIRASGHRKKLLSMTSEVMDSNFPLSDTADIANDR